MADARLDPAAPRQSPPSPPTPAPGLPAAPCRWRRPAFRRPAAGTPGTASRPPAAVPLLPGGRLAPGPPPPSPPGGLCRPSNPCTAMPARRQPARRSRAAGTPGTAQPPTASPNPGSRASVTPTVHPPPAWYPASVRATTRERQVLGASNRPIRPRLRPWPRPGPLTLHGALRCADRRSGSGRWPVAAFLRRRSPILTTWTSSASTPRYPFTDTCWAPPFRRPLYSRLVSVVEAIGMANVPTRAAARWSPTNSSRTRWTGADYPLAWPTTTRAHRHLRALRRRRLFFPAPRWLCSRAQGMQQRPGCHPTLERAAVGRRTGSGCGSNVQGPRQAVREPYKLQRRPRVRQRGAAHRRADSPVRDLAPMRLPR